MMERDFIDGHRDLFDCFHQSDLEFCALLHSLILMIQLVSVVGLDEELLL